MTEFEVATLAVVAAALAALIALAFLLMIRLERRLQKVEQLHFFRRPIPQKSGLGRSTQTGSAIPAIDADKIEEAARPSSRISKARMDPRRKSSKKV